MDAEARTQVRRSPAVMVAFFVGCLAIACQQQSNEAAEVGPDAAATPAQTAGVDTPPRGPAAPAASDTTPAGRTDTAAAGADIEAAADTGRQGPREPAAADTGTATGEGQGAGAQAAGDVLNGWKQYEANCSRCHGQDALGSAFAPDIRKSVGALGHAGFVQVVKEGRPAKGMPGFATQLDDAQINDVIAYLEARSSGKLGPGRPGG